MTTKLSCILFCMLLITLPAISVTGTMYNKNFINSIGEGNWESQESGVTQKLNGISFGEIDIGTIVGDSATILHTDNGGQNWDEQTCEVNLNLYDVSFYDSDIGISVGAEGATSLNGMPRFTS